VKVLEESLRQKYSSRDLRGLLRPFQELAEDYHFWNHNRRLADLAGLEQIGDAENDHALIPMQLCNDSRMVKRFAQSRGLVDPLRKHHHAAAVEGEHQGQLQSSYRVQNLRRRCGIGFDYAIAE
jgi:hypothetical protein